MFTSALKRRKVDKPVARSPSPEVSPVKQSPPKSSVISDNAVIFGQDDAKRALAAWDRKKPLLLCGPSAGKTTLARQALKDYRIWCEDESPSEAVTVLSTRPPLTGGRWAALIECAEGLNDEKGKLVKVLKTAKIPIIITCDDPWERSLRGIKDACQVIQLKQLDRHTAIRAMQAVAEGRFPMSESSCDMILDAASGNIRQAINAMEFLVQTKHRKRDGETVLGTVDKTSDMFTESARICSGEYFEPLTDHDMILLMMSENLPLSARNLDTLADAEQALSFVDLLGYENALSMEVSVRAVSKACSGPHRCPRMQFPAYLGKMSSKQSKIPKIREAAGFVLPIIGPQLSSVCGQDMTDISKVTSLKDGTFLHSIRPYGTEALERLQLHTTKVKAIEKGKKNSKALQNAGLWIASDAMDIVRSGVLTA
jgi:hypothetical protein